MIKAFLKEHKTGMVLTALGGLTALAGYVIDDKKSTYEMQQLKSTVKEEVIEEIRSNPELYLTSKED